MLIHLYDLCLDLLLAFDHVLDWIAHVLNLDEGIIILKNGGSCNIALVHRVNHALRSANRREQLIVLVIEFHRRACIVSSWIANQLVRLQLQWGVNKLLLLAHVIQVALRE